MQIVVMASGTRGDVQPMIALGVALRQAGHAVRLLAGENFSPWIRSYGLEAYPTSDMEALMRSELGVAWVEGDSQLRQLRAMKDLLHLTAGRMIQDTIEGTRGADLLISGFVAEPFGQAISERLSIPQISVALQPYRATSSGPASLLALRPGATSRANRWTGRFAERISWSVASQTVGVLRERLGLPAHTTRTYLRAARQIPALYAMSRHVVPPIADANVHTTGYWFLNEAAAPPADLERFLEAGDPPVYVGFGSMSSSDPAATVRMIVAAAERVGRRAVIGRGWSGAAAPELPATAFLLDAAPHQWLFPRMAALVHHGGAGTTAAGLAAGKPTLIVPHMADQPYWGRRVAELGVGAPPLPRGKLSAAALAERLELLLGDGQIQARAADLGERIRAERGVEEAVAWVNRFIAAQ